MADTTFQIFQGVTRDGVDLYRNETVSREDSLKFIGYLMAHSAYNRKRKTDEEIAKEQAEIDAWKAMTPEEQQEAMRADPKLRMGMRMDQVDVFTTETATLEEAIINYSIESSQVLRRKVASWWDEKGAAAALAALPKTEIEVTDARTIVEPTKV